MRARFSHWAPRACGAGKTPRRIYTFYRRLQQDKWMRRMSLLKYAYVLWAWKTGDFEFFLDHCHAYVYVKACLVGYAKKEPYALMLRSYLPPRYVRRLMRLRKHIKIALPTKGAASVQGYTSALLTCLPVWLWGVRAPTGLRNPSSRYQKEIARRRRSPLHIKNWRRVAETCLETLVDVVKK